MRLPHPAAEHARPLRWMSVWEDRQVATWALIQHVAYEGPGVIGEVAARAGVELAGRPILARFFAAARTRQGS